jgi:hypothetical protein
MIRSKYAGAALALASCSTPNSGQRLTQEAFDAAKTLCGAKDAYLFDIGDRQAIGFRGIASDQAERLVHATCLRHRLNTDVPVGFISEPSER